MTPEEYRYLYELEEHHWWFQGMRRITAALLDGHWPAGALRILDAGCGTGLMLSWLRTCRPGSSSYGVDISSDALHYCSLRGEKLLAQSSIAALPFPAECFDLVSSFEVLDSFAEREVREPFAELARVVKQGGLLLVRVPAFQFLYSQHDRAVYTQHRFRAAEVRARLEEQGLKVERLTYANFFLFPVVVVWRWLTRSSRPDPNSDVRPLPRLLRWLNPVLAGLFSIEAAWLRHLPFRLPFGVSVLALASKPFSGGRKAEVKDHRS
jgi:ubiquinone/menaquinone biosynthesis C-methylase UbiE